MRKILVTGGTGFIASHIVDRYVDLGHEVEVIDNMSTGKESNKREDVVYHNIDIRNPEISNIFHKGKFEVVNHHAAQIDVRKSTQNPTFDAEINILGTLNLLQNVVENNVEKFIFASTGGAIYGDQEHLPVPESSPTNPVSPYGVSKLAVEKYLHYYETEYGLNYNVLRYSNVYGPRQNPHGEAGVVAIFALKLLNGETVKINGDGTQTRDYVYVEDIARLNSKVLTSDETFILNAGTGVENDVNEVFKFVQKFAGSNSEALHGPAVPGEQMRSSIDSSIAKQKLDWDSTTGLEDGIKKTVEFCKTQHF